jgi:hypothetical protein
MRLKLLGFLRLCLPLILSAVYLRPVFAGIMGPPKKVGHKDDSSL